MDNTQQVRLLFITLIPLMSCITGFYYGKDTGAKEAISNANTTIANFQFYSNASKELITLPNNLNNSIGVIEKEIKSLTTQTRTLQEQIQEEIKKNQNYCLPPPSTPAYTVPEQTSGLQNNIITLISTFVSLTCSTLIFKYCGNSGASKDTAVLNLLVKMSERLDRDDELKKILVKLHQSVSKNNNSENYEADVVQVQSNEHQNKTTSTEDKTGKIRLLYSLSSDCGPLQDEISLYMRQAFGKSPQHDLIHVKDALKMPEDGDLLLQFEMVDDRIRDVETKSEYARLLQKKTHKNSVWVFICFKPTSNEEGTRISNSIKGFPSGYTTTDGVFHSTYLTFDYYVKSTKKDTQGNFKHVLADTQQFVQKISLLVQQAKE